jgi:hypothetical protein
MTLKKDVVTALKSKRLTETLTRNQVLQYRANHPYPTLHAASSKKGDTDALLMVLFDQAHFRIRQDEHSWTYSRSEIRHYLSRHNMTGIEMIRSKLMFDVATTCQRSFWFRQQEIRERKQKTLTMLLAQRKCSGRFLHKTYHWVNPK